MSKISTFGLDPNTDYRSDSSGEVRPAPDNRYSIIASEPNGIPSIPSRIDSPHPHHTDLKPLPIVNGHNVQSLGRNGVGVALSDTPAPSVPTSPRMPAMTKNGSGISTPRIRPTTLDIPGLTKSKVSPDGRISQRDVGSKLVIIMVGLPARGKSYITKKMARYLNWLQHDTRIFNVGERRRIAASGGHRQSLSHPHAHFAETNGISSIPDKQKLDPSQMAAKILINGEAQVYAEDGLAPLHLPSPAHPNYDDTQDLAMDDETHAHLEAKFPELARASTPDDEQSTEAMDQSASFFDPKNKKAALIREQCAMETLDELLDYILLAGGSVGIFDATNSTLARRKQIMTKIRERAGPELNVLFVESVCQDQNLLEANMRLKLSGPDYDGKDPVAALEDFKKRVAIYEKNYVPLGDYEEENNMPYVKMVDVGRKVISHQIKGFLSAQAVYYLLNFNLTPRMIWVTRHGESVDNVAGKIGGDSDLSDNGRRYAQAMARFIDQERKMWSIHQADKAANTHFPPHPGDHTPPNPHYGVEGDHNFCVWTSMLKRSIQSAEYFDEEDYETKQMRMLDELNGGIMEGMTYDEIKIQFEEEFNRRKQDKLGYRYPGPGGEGYLDVINRLRPVIVELERMTDHCLLITHRSVARVLLAYFQGLKREDVADLDCPLGMLYQLEPKPYGVEFKAWRYNSDTDDFEWLPDYKLRRAKYIH
ncbi:bifunctional 6-phosphofructo-2-kinase/fructose-2,6-bisphosphate 2-phosphatase [Lepidopterella palustris CBS 459.81]|uniref:Bifunctional 6-phosphofructo-2-kinase/fructose-2,6-bisphosphate 2-phosphatase n=1 Tax=Lepidopterella palustris CBS 459.81 TaxID=1314670 RepID=A0A8E2E522_9PEZI|nr:bifunctional 6-phosphofructo-2-kinase/fructose-2,6-bisphosphate 2-phosphatase [Lepidopterella palustris CBS 459.81]